MTTWVYERDEMHEGDIPAKLNERSAEGWELDRLLPYKLVPDRPFELGYTPTLLVRWYIAVYRRPAN